MGKRLAGMWVLFSVLGCKPPEAPPVVEPDELSPHLIFQDENNYRLTNDIAIQQVEIAETTEIAVDWAGLSTDVTGRAVVPADVEALVIVQYGATPDEVVALLEKNELSSDLSLNTFVFDNEAGAAQTPLSTFDITGLPIDLGLLVEDPASTWLMSLLELPGGRADLLTSKVVVPRAGSANAALSLTNGCMTLDVAVDLSGPPLRTSEGVGPYELVWQDVTTDVFGHPFDPIYADELVIAHFATTDRAEVAAALLRFDQAADAVYRSNAFGVTSALLEEAVDADGVGFGGFTADGTWLVAVFCATCKTPIPHLLSVVVVQ